MTQDNKDREAIRAKATKWREIQVATETWVETLAPKYRIGKTIYTDLLKVIGGAVDDFNDLLATPAPEPIQKDTNEPHRPTIKEFFGENTTLQQVHEAAYLSQPELFSYAQALDNYIDEWIEKTKSELPSDGKQTGS